MRKTIIQTITNILNEDGSLISSNTVEAYVLTPEEGYILKNVKTGEIITTKICLSKKIKINDYIEVVNPDTVN